MRRRSASWRGSASSAKAMRAPISASPASGATICSTPCWPRTLCANPSLTLFVYASVTTPAFRGAGVRATARHCAGLAAMLLCLGPGAALAQLRGAQPAEDLPVKAPAGLPDPEIRLRKPTAITRIGAAAQPADPATDVPGETRKLAPAAIPTPVLEQEPEVARRRPPLEDDPFAPLGIRAGAFLLRPSMEVDFGADSNPGRQPGPVDAAALTRLSPRLDFATDWTRHELRGSIEGGFTHYFGIDDANRPSVNAVVDGRLDLRRGTALEGKLRLSLDTERIGSDGVPEGSSKRPIVLQYGTTIGVAQTLGPATLTLRGLFDRSDYQEVTPGDNRDYASYGIALRGGYEISPAVQPFVEVLTDWRRRDQPVDINGIRRDSQGSSLRGGVALALTGAVTGEAAIGYGARHYEDPTLADIGGVLADASLVWTPTALTTVRLKAATRFEETT